MVADDVDDAPAGLGGETGQGGGEAGMGAQRRPGVSAVVAEEQLEDVAVEDEHPRPGPPFEGYGQLPGGLSGSDG